MIMRVAAVMLVGFIGCQNHGGGDVKLEDTKDKVSYSLGLNIGSSFLKDSITVNPDAFLRGVLDASADSAKRLMSGADVESTMTAFQMDMRTKQMERSNAMGEKNRIEGEAFLTRNSQKEGVVTLPSGLQYKVIKEGAGAKPAASSTVEVHYAGRLIDGTEFDSSYKRGEPAVFRVGGVIKGWTEALQLMKTGSKWEVYVPSSLAYGKEGAGGGVIPPNATLIFELELLSVK